MERDSESAAVLLAKNTVVTSLLLERLPSLRDTWTTPSAEPGIMSHFTPACFIVLQKSILWLRQAAFGCTAEPP